MTTLTVADIPLGTEGPAQRLRRTAAAVRVMLHWWGVHRALTSQQKEEFGSVAAADSRFLTAGKKLIDVRHEAADACSEPCRHLFRGVRSRSLATAAANSFRGADSLARSPGDDTSRLRRADEGEPAGRLLPDA